MEQSERDARVVNSDPPPYTGPIGDNRDIPSVDRYSPCTTELNNFTELPPIITDTSPTPDVTTHDMPNVGGYSILLASATGSSRFILGCMILLLQTITTGIFVSFQTGGTFNILAAGVWCGFYYIACGFLGIASAKDPSICKVTIHLISSAIGLVAFAPCLVIFTVLAFLDARHVQSTTCLACFTQSGRSGECSQETELMCYFNNVVILLNTTLLIFSGLLILVDVINVVACSYSLCIRKHPVQHNNTEPTRFISLPHLPAYSETDPARETDSNETIDGRGLPPPYTVCLNTEDTTIINTQEQLESTYL